MAKTPRKPTAQRLTQEQTDRVAQVVEDAVRRFEGTFDELESAIGMLVLGYYVGWEVLVLMHSKRTIRKYEEILGIVVREEFEKSGSESDRSLAYVAAKKVSNFWKAVSGEAKAFLPAERQLFK